MRMNLHDHVQRATDFVWSASSIVSGADIAYRSMLTITKAQPLNTAPSPAPSAPPPPSVRSALMPGSQSNDNSKAWVAGFGLAVGTLKIPRAMVNIATQTGRMIRGTAAAQAAITGVNPWRHETENDRYGWLWNCMEAALGTVMHMYQAYDQNLMFRNSWGHTAANGCAIGAVVGLFVLDRLIIWHRQHLPAAMNEPRFTRKPLGLADKLMSDPQIWTILSVGVGLLYSGAATATAPTYLDSTLYRTWAPPILLATGAVDVLTAAALCLTKHRHGPLLPTHAMPSSSASRSKPHFVPVRQWTPPSPSPAPTCVIEELD